jgi:hypothetical protein
MNSSKFQPDQTELLPGFGEFTDSREADSVAKVLPTPKPVNRPKRKNSIPSPEKKKLTGELSPSAKCQRAKRAEQKANGLCRVEGSVAKAVKFRLQAKAAAEKKTIQEVVSDLLTEHA